MSEIKMTVSLEDREIFPFYVLFEKRRGDQLREQRRNEHRGQDDRRWGDGHHGAKEVETLVVSVTRDAESITGEIDCDCKYATVFLGRFAYEAFLRRLRMFPTNTFVLHLEGSKVVGFEARSSKRS